MPASIVMPRKHGARQRISRAWPEALLAGIKVAVVFV
jgi:hypothetical protein